MPRGSLQLHRALCPHWLLPSALLTLHNQRACLQCAQEATVGSLDGIRVIPMPLAPCVGAHFLRGPPGAQAAEQVAPAGMAQSRQDGLLCPKALDAYKPKLPGAVESSVRPRSHPETARDPPSPHTHNHSLCACAGGPFTQSLSSAGSRLTWPKEPGAAAPSDAPQCASEPCCGGHALQSTTDPPQYRPAP